MRRRLDLAAALVARPPVLFLDEPTTGLDPRSRLALWDTIESLVSGGATVLLTTQYLDEADRLADRIAVIDHGRVIAEGTPGELKAQMRRRAAGGSAGRPRSGTRRRSRRSRRWQQGARRSGLDRSVPLRERKGAVAEAVRRLDSAGVGVDDLVVVSPTLDDVFLQLTGHGAEEERGGQRDEPRVRGLGHARPGEAEPARIPRQPDLLVGFTVQPIMFVLLFVYVFGGAISTPGLDYVDFLIPGIIVQSMTFGGFVTALGLSEDLKKGLIDRFRSLPMSRAAVLTGRTLADGGDERRAARRSCSPSDSRSASASHGVAEHRRRDRALPADRLRVLVGVRVHRPDRLLAGGGERLRLHDPLPAHVRLLRVRAGGVDAELAAADRREQPVHEHGQRGARAVRRHACGQSDLAGGGLVAGDHGRLQLARGLALPPRRRAVSRPRRPPAGNRLRSSQRSRRRGHAYACKATGFEMRDV